MEGSLRDSKVEVVASRLLDIQPVNSGVIGVKELGVLGRELGLSLKELSVFHVCMGRGP